MFWIGLIKISIMDPIMLCSYQFHNIFTRYSKEQVFIGSFNMGLLLKIFFYPIFCCENIVKLL